VECFDFQAPPIDNVVSTVGAGDSFNAGFACAIVWEGIMPEDLSHAGRDTWQRLVDTACRFAGETCRSTENYISPLFP
jgi:fructokinase